MATARDGIAAAQRVFEQRGSPDQTGVEEFDGEHQFWGRGAFSFLGHWL
jgi:hypothetical protein